MSTLATARANNTVAAATIPHSCPTSRVTVLSASAQDRSDICASAIDALEYLAALGLETDVDVSVEVLTRLPEICGIDAVGCYVLAERRVLLLSHDSLASRECLLELPIDRSIYCTLAVHEIVHAVMAWNVAPATPSMLAMEYLSAVVSIAVMDPQHRQQLLDRLPGQGFANESEISLTYYLLSPARFSVKAYRHFIRLESGAAFIGAVLAGEALTDRNPHIR